MGRYPPRRITLRYESCYQLKAYLKGGYGILRLQLARNYALELCTMIEPRPYLNFVYICRT